MDIWETFYGCDESWFSSKKCVYTSAEIARQGDLWRVLGSYLLSKEDTILDFIGRMGGLGKRRIILTGAGSSAFAGETAALMAGKAWGLPVESIHTTDIVSSPYSVLFPDVPTLLVSFGRSGNSPESTEAVKYVRTIVKDLYELTLVCDGESNLAKITSTGKGLALIMPEGSNDNGFAMTSSFTCMALAGCAFLSAGKIRAVVEDINRLAGVFDRQGKALAAVARKWAETGYDRLVALGSGCLRGLSREAALKSLELTAGEVSTGWDSSLGFRHGPKSIIRDKTLTIHFVSPDSFTARYDLDLLDEINRQKKGNKVIALSGEKLSIPVDENIVIGGEGYGETGEICRGISYLVFCQLLAMFKSLSLGIPTDNPVPSGELTRVVSGVTLYELEK